MRAINEKFGAVPVWAGALILLLWPACVPAIAQGGAQAPEAAQDELKRVAAAAKQPLPYVLRPGDELEIRAYNLPQLNQSVRVRPDGKISLVLLNDVDAAGLTPAELGKRLSALYVEQEFREPRLTVVVMNFSGYSVYVGGEVGQPGQVPLAGDLTLMSAVIKAGGFRDTAAVKNVILLRDSGSGAPVTITANVEDVIRKSKPDMVLQPGDVVYVPKSAINVYVGGEVVEPGLVPLEGNLTALAAVLKAKGFRPTAKLNSVILLRNNGDGKPQITRVDLGDVAEKGKTDLTLQPYDVVYVPKARISKANEFIDRYFRQLLPVSANVGFSYLLGATVF
jgi:protein involved in polysaccharide export with SLBB domain